MLTYEYGHLFQIEFLSKILKTFMNDPLANSIAVVILILMVFSAIYVLIDFNRGKRSFLNRIPNWIIPILAILGFIIAGYLTYIEVNQVTAVCGPIGNCNQVQQSQYSRLFDLIPIGIIGLFGFLIILVLSLLQIIIKTRYRNIIGFINWVVIWFGLLFSIYLTFLEPFIIGATCAWCITSALIITIMLWAATKNAKEYWSYFENEAT